MHRVWLACGLSACGSSGEPITGDIALTYGDRMPDLVVGSAVPDNDLMRVQLGTEGVNCDTRLDSVEVGGWGDLQGFFVDIEIPRAPGVHEDVFITIAEITSDTYFGNGDFGTVTIDGVEPRVTGTITVATTNDEVGDITVSGTFDIVRCFD